MAKYKTISFLLVAWLLFSSHPTPLGAQTNLGREGIPTHHQAFREFLQQPFYQRNELLGGHYYRLIRFRSVPSSQTIQALQDAGIQLLEYTTAKTYLASISTALNVNDIRHLPIEQLSDQHLQYKMANTLQQAEINHGRLDLLVQYHADLNHGLVRYFLEHLKAEITGFNEDYRLFRLSLPAPKLDDLAQLTAIRYIEDYPQDVVLEDLMANHLHRANLRPMANNSGLTLDGGGVHVAIADDGFVGPHIDFQGRAIQDVVSGASTSGAHGDIMAGILIGAGNLDPTKKGVASGATLHVLNIFDPVDINSDNGLDERIVITSNSYGEGCNRGYTIFAQSIDRKIRRAQNIMHIFSAGNSGQEDCGFGAGIGWGTITGGSKMGKNVITVGNVDPFDKIVPSSSKGPASDGRIKPDLCANGDGQLSTAQGNKYTTASGSSASAPVVSGIAAQLYQGYRVLNDGQDPSSALIKACLLNTAEDLGPRGPDFSYGWGRANARKAFRIIEQRHFIKDQITNQASKTFQIEVPGNAQSLSVMIYWHDWEGAPSSEIALVNDLDMQITTADNRTVYPWNLNPNIEAGQLFEPAVQGNDHLNNVEQIVIPNPNPGQYTINIDGFRVPKGPQEFFLVYDIEERPITLTYPVGGERLTPGQTDRIYWDVNNSKEPIRIEFSDDLGASWELVAVVANGNQQFDWEVPQTDSGKGMIRLQRNGLISQSIEAFDIVPVPQNLQILEVCPGFTRLGWDAVEEANEYIVYRLGDEYMDSILAVPGNIADISIDNTNFRNWYAVQAVYTNGAKSQRSVAIFDPHVLTTCLAENDLSIQSIQSPSYPIITNCADETQQVGVNISNNGSNKQRDFQLHYQVNQEEIVSESFTGTLIPTTTIHYTFNQRLNLSEPGSYQIKVWTDMPSDEATYNDTAHFELFVEESVAYSLPYFENFDQFENCNPAASCNSHCPLENGWTNLDGQAEDNIDWRVHNGATPSNGTGPETDQNTGTEDGKYLYLESSNSCFNKQAVLMSPCFDLTNIEHPILTFWYHMHGQDIGQLNIGLFDGEKWRDHIMFPLVGKQGNSWKKSPEIDLSAFSGRKVNIRFTANTGSAFSADLAIDNIGLFERNAPPVTNFTFDRSQDCVGQAVRFFDNSFNSPTSWHWEFSPSDVQFINGSSATSSNPTVLFNRQGSYQVKLITANTFGTDTLETSSNFIQLSSGYPIPIQENFDDYGTDESDNWQIINPDDEITWSYVNVIGSEGIPTAAAYVDNHGYNAVGEQDQLVSYAVDLVDGRNPMLRFDLSYAPGNYSADQLLIKVVDQCEPERDTVIYHKSGRKLATTVQQNRGWRPESPAHWRTENVSLAAFTGRSISLSFINICGYGNNIYLDNITIAESSDLPVAGFHILPAVEEFNCPGDTIRLINTSLGDNNFEYTWYLEYNDSVDILKGLGPHQHILMHGGDYNISLLAKNPVGSSITHHRVRVLDNAEAAFTFKQQDGGGVEFVNASSDANYFRWDFGDGQTSLEVNPQHYYRKNDFYTVQLKASNACSESIFEQELTITTNLREPAAEQTMKLYPNPAQHNIQVSLPYSSIETINFRLFDLSGRLLTDFSQSVDAMGNGNYRINIDAFPAGAYLMQVNTKTNQYTAKLVVMK
ncbi:MAG: S8 family serine peptidase [Bacteroidota bacterium]